MKYVDIHAHLDHSRFKDDLDGVIDRCREEDVKVICSGVNSVTNRIALDIASNYPDVVKVSFGLYPLDALEKEIKEAEVFEEKSFPRDIDGFSVEEELEYLKKNEEKFVAVGEIGLDYNWDEIRNSNFLKDKQKENFKKILKVAKEVEKPVVVHTRKAEKDCIDILEGFELAGVVLHCFQGNKKLIKRAIDLGFYFSVPPVITRLQHFQMLVDLVPLDRLLTETDSPYLSPVSGERNEPINVKITVGEIAKIKGLEEADVRKKILDNSERVFGI